MKTRVQGNEVTKNKQSISNWRKHEVRIRTTKKKPLRQVRCYNNNRSLAGIANREHMIDTWSSEREEK